MLNDELFEHLGLDAARLRHQLQRKAVQAHRIRRRRIERVSAQLAAPPAPLSEYAPGPSALGNYFLTLDGEGVGNEYVLLDSCLESWPGLWRGGQRLQTAEILDWLWELGKRHGYAQLAIYGASYDFNHWVRGTVADGRKWIHDGHYEVRLGDYSIRWMRGYAFLIYKIKGWKDDKPVYERIQSWNPQHNRRRDISRLLVYDVLPFWQTRFEKALDKTLSEPDGRELIEWGKAMRGDFQNSHFESGGQGRAYNKAELRNLAQMLIELDRWFAAVGLRVAAYNGPGAVAKAKLQQERIWLHNGRRFEYRNGDSARKGGRPKVLEYQAPWEVIWAAINAYAGGRVQCWRVGRAPLAYNYDLRSAYPAAMLRLPCLTHGSWERPQKFDARSFGLWRIRYRATHELPSYPFFWRDKDGSIHYPAAISERWAYTPEVMSAIRHDHQGLEILEGWLWKPGSCTNPQPLLFNRLLFDQRQLALQAVAVGDLTRQGEANAYKLVMNSEYGGMAQARGGNPAAPPWTQQLIWAGMITAQVRSQLYDAAMLDPGAIVHLATDGLMSTRPLPLPLSDQLGGWGCEEVTNLLVYQPGRYFCDQQTRSRGFDSDSLTAEDVLKSWRRGRQCMQLVEGKPCKVHTPHLHMKERRFHTLGLVTLQHAPERWCEWTDVPIVIETSGIHMPFQRGGSPNQLKQVARRKDPQLRMVPVSELSYPGDPNLPSWAYEPKWTIPGAAPDPGFDWSESDAIAEARAIDG